MNLKIFLAGYILVFLSACSFKEDLCAAYQCSAPVVNLKLKYIDSSRQDLFFSANAIYNLSDLKIRNESSTIDLQFGIDSTEKSNKYLILPVSYSQNLKLKLANKPEDSIQIETAFITEKCCETIKVLSLKLNGKGICTSCSILKPIILIK